MEHKQPLTAYFCMEFGLSSEFKIYAGGLGILAGDILKAAKDTGMPMVGVGMLWRQGSTRQIIDENDRVTDCFPEYRYDFLKDTGVTVAVEIRRRAVYAKVWECDCFGNAPLYLLDTNLPGNRDRLLSGQLYGWFGEERIAQEMLLGIGGVRALRALGITPDVYHFNDSHPLFAAFELIREQMAAGNSFARAWERVRAQTVFTTHTPVEAGNEVHEHELLEYMGAGDGLTKEQLVALGGDPFNMTVAGLRVSRLANAVAQLHGETARKMWAGTENAAPIIAITNGVHNGTWQDADIARAFSEGTSLRAAHENCRERLFSQVLRRTGVRLRPEALTVGFARRAAPYKRGSLIFSEPEKIEPVLASGRMQLIFSGKAHPNDLDGKEIVSQMVKMSRKYPDAVVFLQDYDMELGALLTRGCDVWLNTPRRPMEASGTSGMKAAMNGVLNVSILDGWWPEGCVDGVTGWRIGDEREAEPGKEAEQDRRDSAALYDVLLGKVLPLWEEQPAAWEKMMRESVAMSAQAFSAARMVREYAARMYQTEDGQNG